MIEHYLLLLLTTIMQKNEYPFEWPPLLLPFCWTKMKSKARWVECAKSAGGIVVRANAPRVWPIGHFVEHHWHTLFHSEHWSCIHCRIWNDFEQIKRQEKEGIENHRTYLFFRCWAEPRQRSVPLTIMAKRVQRTWHSSIECEVNRIERESFNASIIADHKERRAFRFMPLNGSS